MSSAKREATLARTGVDGSGDGAGGEGAAGGGGAEGAEDAGGAGDGGGPEEPRVACGAEDGVETGVRRDSLSAMAFANGFPISP